MTAIVRAPLQGEIIAPGKGLTLIVVPRILDIEALPPIEVAAGLSLAELAVRGVAMAGGKARFIASINGLPVEEELWSRVRPKPGTSVLLRAVPEFGGDGNFVNTLLSAAVVVAGAVLTAVNPLLGAAVTVGGQMLVNALFPVAPPVMAAVDNGSVSSPTYAIGGSSNSADQWGVIPAHLGRNRYTPKLGAKTYTEFVGADVYLRMLVVWGYGPLEISDIKIGETPLASFADVEVETNLGYPDDPPITLYPNEVEQEDLSIEISAGAGPQMRTTAPNVDEISGDFVAPNGIGRIDGNGSTQSYTVQLKVEYRLTGSGDPWAVLTTQALSGRSRDPIRVGFRLAVAIAGQYDVQVSKTSADAGSDQVIEQVIWSALRGFRTAPPISFGKPLAVTALRIRASSQLNGQIDDLNGIVASKGKAFDGAAWQDDAVSSNPADLFRLVCQGAAIAKPLSDDGLDLESIEPWWAFCRDNGYTFNLVRDFAASVDDALVQIAAAGRATVKRRDGKRGVVWDDPDAPVVQVFTPRNSWGFAWERVYQKAPPHALRIRFINAQAGYAQDERIVYADGYNADGSGGLVKATLFEEIEEPGKTDPDEVWKFGRYRLAQAQLRPQSYTLNADLNSFAVSRGARVRAMSDVALWGIGAGRALSAMAAGDDDQVVLDEPVTMEAGKSYVIRFWLSDSSTGTRDVVLAEGETDTLTLSGHGLLPEADDQWVFGELGKDSVVLRVQKVTPGPNLSAKLTLVDDAPEIGLADQGAIPPFDSKITIPADPFTAAPINLAVSEAFEGVDGATATGALFQWDTVAGEQATSFDVEYRDDDGDGVYKAGGNVPAPTKALFLAGLLQGHWSFRVRCVFADGSLSKWSELARADITAGSGLTLPDVTKFVTSFVDSTSALTWDEVGPLDTRYEIRKGDSWDSALTVGVDLAHPPFTTRGNGIYWIKAKRQPLPGITVYSENAASIAIAGSILVRNVVATLDEHANGWTGPISGPAAIDGEVIKTSAAGVLAYYEINADRIYDLGFSRRVRIEASWKAVGVPVNQNILDDPDFLNNPDVLSATSSQFIEAWPEIAVAGDLEGDVFAAGDVFASPDIFTGSAVFAPYQKFAPGEYQGRFFKLRAAFRSNDASVYAALTEFIITADVPDRLDIYSSLAVPAGGVTVTFKPNGAAETKPFMGGPGVDPLPHYQITLLDGLAGDQLAIVDLTLTAISFKYLNGGLDVARTVNLQVQGW